jgi:hypothetical protein
MLPDVRAKLVVRFPVILLIRAMLPEDSQSSSDRLLLSLIACNTIVSIMMIVGARSGLKPDGYDFKAC